MWASQQMIRQNLPKYVLDDPQFKEEVEISWQDTVDKIICTRNQGIVMQKHTIYITKNCFHPIPFSYYLTPVVVPVDNGGRYPPEYPAVLVKKTPTHPAHSHICQTAFVCHHSRLHL